MDPCENPVSLQPTEQTPPPDYYYTGTTNMIDFTLDPFVVNPDSCNFEYSCAFISGPRTDLDICNFFDFATSETSFNPQTGQFTMHTTDKVGFPPGTYWMEVTGTVGQSSTKTLVPITLVDPCNTAELALNPTPFFDEDYFLRDPKESETWDLN